MLEMKKTRKKRDKNSFSLKEIGVRKQLVVGVGGKEASLTF
jgi:hypothetical protein